MRGILEDADRSPPARLGALVHAFIRSECEEAQIRVALNDAAPLYRDAPEAEQARGQGAQIFQAFVREVLPHMADASRSLVADLIGTTLSEVGSSFSVKQRTEPEIDAYAEALACMLCAYLEVLTKRSD